MLRLLRTEGDALDQVREDLDDIEAGYRPRTGRRLRFLPGRANFVHTRITRADGRVEDGGWRHNLKTTVGMDWLHNAMGGVLPTGGQGSPATATGASSFTATGTPWTVNQLAGMRAVFPVTGLTTAPVYGNIISNTTSVATIDQWWTGADTTGTTPASTNAFIILPGQAPARYVALTTDTGAPAVGDTALTSEQNANGVSRALAAFAHTGGTTTFTLSKTWTASGTITALHKAGLFTSGTAAGGGILVADTVLNANATLANGDQLALTWTWTLPAAG